MTRLLPSDSDESDSEATSRRCTDVESLTNDGEHSQRFTYEPKNVMERVLVSLYIKNKLDTSKIVYLTYRTRYKYVLILVLLLITLFLTPSLLPKWLGFKWAAPDDLCRSPDDKLDVLRATVHNVTNFQESKMFLFKQSFRFHCMNHSAAAFYYGNVREPKRFRWPWECTSEVAQVSLIEQQCHSQSANVCHAVGGVLGFFASLGGNCVREVGPELCVDTTNADRANALLELEQLRSQPPSLRNVTITEEGIATTANERAKRVVSKLLTQIDLAADAFIVYSLVAIVVGVPLVIYRREKGSMVVSAAFGLTKVWFIFLFVVLLTVYDSAAIVMREVEFGRLFQNFMRDPCYIDPQFSAQRVAMIADVCGELASIDAQSDVLRQRMDNLYYDVRMFGYCKDATRSLSVHPRLKELDGLRMRYHNGSIGNPGNCNATELNRLTSVAPDDTGPKWEALFASGILAQLLLKFVLCTWVVHCIAFIEPMVLHNGKVEIWGPFEKDERLSEPEEEAVTRFSKDRHLLAFIVCSALLCAEIGLIIYSIMTNETAQLIDVDIGPIPVDPDEVVDVICPSSIFS